MLMLVVITLQKLPIAVTSSLRLLPGLLKTLQCFQQQTCKLTKNGFGENLNIAISTMQGCRRDDLESTEGKAPEKLAHDHLLFGGHRHCTWCYCHRRYRYWFLTIYAKIVEAIHCLPLWLSLLFHLSPAAVCTRSNIWFTYSFYIVFYCLVFYLQFSSFT